MNKEIINMNNKSQWHGYIQLLDSQEKVIVSRGNWKNDRPTGYTEIHSDDILGLSPLTIFHII